MKKIFFSFFLFMSFVIAFANDINLPPDVSEEMLNAEYWIQKTANPYKIRMSKEDIAVFNSNISNLYPNNEISYKIFTDLRSIDYELSAKKILAGMQKYNPKVVWYKKTSNGEIKALTKKDWNEFSNKMNCSILEKSGNEKDFTIRKAVCIARTNAVSIPIDEELSIDKDYWFDNYNSVSAILMNEPLLVLWESSDKNWYYVQASSFSGWVKAEFIAFVSDEQFEEYFDYVEKCIKSDKTNFITITSDRIHLEKRYYIDDEKEEIPDLFMGTYLKIKDWNEEPFNSRFLPRIPHASYVAEIPIKKDDGTLGFRYVSISAGDCTRGLLPYTQANVLNLIFKSLGKRYGWGGMEESRDCSGMVQEIHRCFGFTFAKNSYAQSLMPGKTIDLRKMNESQKSSKYKKMPAGTILYLPGHIYFYLGYENGKHYALSSAGGYYLEKDENNVALKDSLIDAESVYVNTLDILRKNGKTWSENTLTAKLLEKPDNSLQIKLNPKWKFASFSKINTGSATLIKAFENRKNIVVSVNAGHGTKNGSKVKTYCHPDKSPKLISGSTEKDVIEGYAITDGMTFKNGIKEAKVNLRTANALKDALLKEGYDVLMIRSNSDVQLDNIARTVISNNVANIHIAIHYNSDSEDSDKGVFYCGSPNELRKLKNVEKNYEKSELLGKCLVEGLKDEGFEVLENGRFEIDLTQNSYSTIPTVDIELGNDKAEISTLTVQQQIKGLVKGVNEFFKK